MNNKKFLIIPLIIGTVLGALLALQAISMWANSNEVQSTVRTAEDRPQTEDFMDTVIKQLKGNPQIEAYEDGSFYFYGQTGCIEGQLCDSPVKEFRE